MTFPLPNVSNDLNGRVALVTGASSGFGVRFAKALAACGAKVGLAARRVDRLEAVAEEIRAASGVEVGIHVVWLTAARTALASTQTMVARIGSPHPRCTVRG